ncbi:MAG: glycosyltransferase family 2 protein [Ilumatobacter sp.]|uniref:glycosyltransferase family 2 protein n=1 Tax=Ilumatobacter sp. TaxID=1967498 RepID=UPI00391A3BE5
MNGDNLPTTSIVIRALNEAEHLPALYSGLLRQTQQPDQIVLVDSGSTDDTVAISEAHGADIVRIAPEDFSFGRSLNIGCAAATGDILIFVSAHVYPIDEHWLANLVEPFERDEVVLSYGRQTGDHRTKFSELQLLRQWFPDVSDPDQRTPFCNNANCAVRRSEWEQRHYDEELTGLEDLAWAEQALKRGGKIAYRSDATIAHIHDEHFPRIRNRYRREAIAHRRIFDDQRLGAFEAVMLFGANVARDYLAAAARRQLLRNLVDIPSFRAAQYLGTWEGFRSRGDVSTELKRRFYYPKGIDFRATRQPSNRSN